MAFKRILLKLSGEALMGDKQFGIDNNRLALYAQEIKEIVNQGVQVAIVIGGGILGSSIVYNLSKLGYNVVWFENISLAWFSTSRSAGLIIHGPWR